MLLDIEPALASLAQQVESRVFMSLKVEEILAGVIDGGLADYDRSVIGLDGLTPNVREHCVQYQETDLDFAHRLMEEEGLTYYFWNGGDREEVVLVGANEDFPQVPDAPPHGFLVTGPHAEASQSDCLVDFVEHQRTTSTAVTIAELDWKRSPTAPFLVNGDDADDRGRRRSVYDHARALTAAGRLLAVHRAGDRVAVVEDAVGRRSPAVSGLPSSRLRWRGPPEEVSGPLPGCRALSALARDLSALSSWTLASPPRR